MDERDDIPTWTQQREAALELWADEHLAALAELQAMDLRDPAVLRAITTRATELAAVAEHLGQLRGSLTQEELLLAAFRNQLVDL
jgi:hypothetical protein